MLVTQDCPCEFNPRKPHEGVQKELVPQYSSDLCDMHVYIISIIHTYTCTHTHAQTHAHNNNNFNNKI